MAELRNIDLPPHLANMTEFQLLDEVSESQISDLYDEIEARHEDLLILEATEIGTARREKILGIIPDPDDTLDMRRSRVLLKWYTKDIFTRTVIERKIITICGEGNAYFEFDPDELTYLVKIGGVGWDIIDVVKDTLEELVMLNIILDVRKVIVTGLEVPFYVAFKMLGSLERAPMIIEEEEE